MKNKVFTLLYFIGVSIVNLYPIYISIAMVGFVNRSGHDVDGWLNVSMFALGITFLAVVIALPVYIIGWQFGDKKLTFFRTKVYGGLIAIIVMSLMAWYVYTAIRLY